MKKTICLSFFCLCTCVTFSQLKVAPDGKVAVGTTGTPISNFSVGTPGEQNCRSMLEGDIVTLRVNGLGRSPYEAQWWGTSIFVFHDVSSTRGDIGIECNAIKRSSLGSGQAIGLVASAGNATHGYNWGIIGDLEGSYNGAGVLGIVGGSRGIKITDGQYAGYFHGNVKVTGVLNGVVVGNSDIRYKDNVQEISKASTSTVLNTITRLNPVSYNYKQIYLETDNSADSLHVTSRAGQSNRQALYNEKSPMFQKKHFGLVAQDLQAIYPDLVYENDNGYLAINYIELIPLLIQSIKELKAEVDLLSAPSIKNPIALMSGKQAGSADAVLHQNAPGSFADKTEIKFELPENAADASVMIFDMQGALVKQIPVTGRQSNITLKGSELKAGMYLYSLIVDGKEADTKRMILTN